MDVNIHGDSREGGIRQVKPQHPRGEIEVGKEKRAGKMHKHDLRVSVRGESKILVQPEATFGAVGENCGVDRGKESVSGRDTMLDEAQGQAPSHNISKKPQHSI